MIERVLIVALFAIIGFGAYHIWKRQQLKRAGAYGTSDPLLATARHNIPTIVYFTTPTCAPCKLQQTPNLERLHRELGDEGLQIIRVDATKDPDAAGRWGVFSVPTTFIIDHTGKPRHVHNGVVSVEKLKSQIEAISA